MHLYAIPTKVSKLSKIIDIIIFIFNIKKLDVCNYFISRIINKTLELNFLGQKPQVFKPGMLFETQVSIKFSDQVLLSFDYPYLLRIGKCR